MLIKTKKTLVALNIFTLDHINEADVNSDNEDDVIMRSPSYGHLINKHGLTDEDIKLELLVTQTKDIRTIKLIAIAFLVLSIIGFVISVIGYMAALA